MSALTPHQQKVMIFLKAHVETHGVPPSYAEIGSAFGIKSKHGVSNLLDILQRGGFIHRTSKARSLQLLQSEYHHTPDCNCAACVNARYLARLQLVHALEVSPPISPARLKGLRALTLSKRDAWLARKRGPKARVQAVQ